MQTTTLGATRNLGIVLAICCTVGTSLAHAGPREQAKRIHDRLVGVPATNTVLDSMADKIANGNSIDAAYEAMDNPAFYNTTVAEFATPWSNREQSLFADTNDFVATVIGMVRDDVPFDQVLYEDIVYVGTPNATSVSHSHTDNDHYLDLQLNRVDLSDPTNLAQQRQSDLPNSPIAAGETAGVMTTRGFSQAFLVAGTNRAAIRFATLNFLCMDMEDFRDLTAHPDRIRQDVSRSPGGDSSIFLNDCLSCHAGMDGLAGAFAHYDFDEDAQQLVYTADAVQPKFLNDAGAFRFGYATTDDSWINYWRTGPNEYVGWNGPSSGAGTGAKSLGMELAQTRQFSRCQVKKAFEKVCYRKPNGAADEQAVETIATSFESNNRSMKRVFAETALHCMGD
jgi:hypothetical protein